MSHRCLVPWQSCISVPVLKNEGLRPEQVQRRLLGCPGHRSPAQKRSLEGQSSSSLANEGLEGIGLLAIDGAGQAAPASQRMQHRNNGWTLAVSTSRLQVRWSLAVRAAGFMPSLPSV